MASLQCYPDQSNYNHIKPAVTTTTATHTYIKDTYEQDSYGKNTTYGGITPSHGHSNHGGYGATHGYNNTAATHGHHNNSAGHGHHITPITHGHGHNNSAGHGHHITTATHGHGHINTAGYGPHDNTIAAHGHPNGHGVSKIHSHSGYSHGKSVHGRRHRKVKKEGCSDYSSDSSDSDCD